jgi:16S rRNA (uracil1498-N3)-methyltransferase
VTPQFFVAENQVESEQALLDEDDTRHLVTVLRARTGMRVRIADNTGSVWAGSYQGLSKGRARVALTDRTVVSTPQPAITVVHALPKQRKLDDVIQRLTELGVDRIVPVHSERSQVELDERRAAKAVTRWRSVALAAAKQSHRARLPQVSDVGEWSTAFDPATPGVVCWEGSTTPLGAALDAIDRPPRFVIAIGPEGGLTEEEVAASGLPSVSLGRSILRTETAALVAVSAVSYHYGLMESE